jgi:putative tryptophan/tyrosine transport system substrate-binding protein
MASYIERRTFLATLGGAAATWPLVARAQQSERVRRIGVLAAHERHVPEFDGFREQLRELAYVEGKNLVIDWRYAEQGTGQLPILAKQLVDLNPDVIVSITTPATAAVKAATGSIPIVFANVGDPVGTGFVASLAHPGGNVTGQSIIAVQLSAKRLELLKEMIPTSSLAAVIWNSTNAAVRLAWQETQEAATLLGMRLISIEVRMADDIASAFDIAKQQGAQGLIVVPEPVTASHRSAIIELAAKTRMPTMYGQREYVDDGGLMAYGPNYRAVFRRAAIYVDKILKGTKPADLPVEQPTKFELVINLKTAKALGLEIPQTLLARADEVIE